MIGERISPTATIASQFITHRSRNRISVYQDAHQFTCRKQKFSFHLKWNYIYFIQICALMGPVVAVDGDSNTWTRNRTSSATMNRSKDKLHTWPHWSTWRFFFQFSFISFEISFEWTSIVWLVNRNWKLITMPSSGFTQLTTLLYVVPISTGRCRGRASEH